MNEQEIKAPQNTQDQTKDDDLRTEILERYKSIGSFYEDWEEVAKEDYNFALGEQWTAEERQTLKDESRPCLTFNRIRPIINIISGYQRENQSRIKVNPEGQEDKTFSEFCDKIISAVDKWGKLNYKLGYLFDDGLYCGKGWLEAIFCYDKDPVRGELKFVLDGPYQVKVDPSCKEYDINDDAEYLFKVSRLTKSKLKALYPKKKRIIDGFITDNDDPVENGGGLLKEGADDDYENKPNITTVTTREDDETESDLEQDEKFLVKEYWRKKYVERYYVIDIETGEPKRFDTKGEAEQFAGTQGAGMKVIARTIPEMWVAAMVCGIILQDVISPFEPNYNGFPFFRFIADWAPSAENETLRTQGVVRALKDPQREKNKAKSQNLHILNTQANSGWVGDDNALSEAGKKKLEEMGSKPGITVWKKPGAELREILPKGPNAGMIQREQAADEEFKQVSAINPDLMGMQEGTASGKAIGLRIKQAVMSLVRIFYNYRYTKEIIGNFILQVIPVMFDTQKAMKVVGPDWMMKSVDPMKYPQGLAEGHIQAFLQMISDNKYDVFITESDQNATLRYETFTQLVELLKAGMPIPPDLVIDYLDIPNAEEIKQKMLAQMQMQQQMEQQAMMMKSMPKQAPPKEGGDKPA